MGNSNETLLNSEANLDSLLFNNNNIIKEKEKPGFFQSIFCCSSENNFHDNYKSKTDLLNLEYYWYFQVITDNLKSSSQSLPWVPYSIELNNIIESAFTRKMQSVKFNFPDNNNIQYIIEFDKMVQIELNKKQNLNNSNNNLFSNNGIPYQNGSNNDINQDSNTIRNNSMLRVRRFHRDEEKFIMRKRTLEKMNFLSSINFIIEYNNTHNIQKPIKICNLFKNLSFPIKCLDVFNQEIYITNEIITSLFKYFNNYRINSFPHFKQLLTQEISNEVEKLNNFYQRKNNNIFNGINIQNNSNDNIGFSSQGEIYNEIIDTRMNQDNLEIIIIYLFNLEGFIYDVINDCLVNNTVENSNLKLLFVVFLGSLIGRCDNDPHKFIKINSLFSEESNNKKQLKLYKGCNLSNEMIVKYLDMLKPCENKSTKQNNLGIKSRKFYFNFFKFFI